MSKLTTSFTEASMDPTKDARDPETVALHQNSPSNASQNMINILNEALNGNLDPIKKVRSTQSTQISEGVSHFDVSVKYQDRTIQTRHYFPTKTADRTTLPMILFIHGGGWCFSSIEHRNHFASELSKRHNLEVISVNNSLSPETPFGVALDELFEVYSSLVSESNSERKIFVCGDSSGGNQAPCLIHKILLKKDLRRPDALLVFYPVIDLVNDYESYHIYQSGFSLNFDLMRKYIDCYCPDVEKRKSSLASPIYGDLEMFPPSLVVTSQFDILRNEGLAFAKKLDKSGVAVRYICLESAEHGFLNHPGLKKIENICHSYISDFLKFFI